MSKDLKMAQDRFKMPLHGPKYPKMAQDGPRWSEIIPRWPQNGPKMTQKRPLDATRHPLGAPGWSQDGPKVSPRASKQLKKRVGHCQGARKDSNLISKVLKMVKGSSEVVLNGPR